jgi:hypothetical protein
LDSERRPDHDRAAAAAGVYDYTQDPTAQHAVVKRGIDPKLLSHREEQEVLPTMPVDAWSGSPVVDAVVADLVLPDVQSAL